MLNGAIFRSCFFSVLPLPPRKFFCRRPCLALFAFHVKLGHLAPNLARKACFMKKGLRYPYACYKNVISSVGKHYCALRLGLELGLGLGLGLGLAEMHFRSNAFSPYGKSGKVPYGKTVPGPRLQSADELSIVLFLLLSLIDNGYLASTHLFHLLAPHHQE